MASDGSEFLALLSTEHGRSERVFVQKIAANGAHVGPQRQIGAGTPAGLVWTGSDYLAAWQNGDGLWIAPVSREGSLRSTPAAPILSADKSYLAANGQAVLAFGYSEWYLTVQPLDAAGRPQGTPIKYVAPARRANFTVAATPGGFTAVFSGYNGTWMMRFRTDGTAFEAVLLDGPYTGSSGDYHSNGAAIATDGTSTLIIFGAGRYEHEAHLRSVTVGPDGRVKRSGVIYELAMGGDRGIAPAGLVWDGTQYLAALNVAQTTSPIEPSPASMLLRIDRNGERDGEPQFVDDQKRWFMKGLAWNGRELLYMLFAGQSEYPSWLSSAVLDPSTMRTTMPLKPGRTLSTHRYFEIETGHGGYLAAWFEHGRSQTTVRASRIDRNGNFLDAEGIILDSFPPSDARYAYDRRIDIDGSGPQWFVVWSHGPTVRARSISLDGKPVGTSAFPLGGGGQRVAARWAGQYYIVLRSHGSLHRDLVTGNGNLLETKVLAAAHENPADDSYVTYLEPALVRLRDRILAVFTKDTTRCWLGHPRSCSTEMTLLGLDVQTPGAEAFLIATDVLGGGRVAASPDQALVIWKSSEGVARALLHAEAPEQPSAPQQLVEARAGRPDVAFDGSNFVAVWWRYASPGPAFLVAASIDLQGTLGALTPMPLLNIEEAWNPAVAAGASLPALISYDDRDAMYDGAPQAMLLFASEIGEQPAAPPTAPEIVCATENADGTVTVRWLPVQDVLGISIELQLSDGTFRPIGVAPAGATSARASLAGLPHSAVRVRAWNAAGLSAASSLAPSVPPPTAILRSTARACAGVPLTVNVTLRGSAPFTIHWSDGMVQSNVKSSSTSRTVTATGNKTLKIVRVTDASCAANEEQESIRITVDPLPTVSVAESELRIARGATATLTVSTSHAERHQWYEGDSGDTSRPVGTNAPTFTPPPLQRSTRYWARVSNRCGHADSAAITVTVPATKGRAVRH